MGILAITFLPSLVPRIAINNGISNVIPGPLFPVFIGYVLAAITVSTLLMYISMRRTKGLEHARATYILYGFMVTALLVSITNLFAPLITKSNSISAYGTYPILIFITTSTIAIIRHRLFDIRLIAARSFTYTLLLATLGLTYAVVAFYIGGLLFKNSTTSTGQEIFNVILTLVLAFTFQPLRRFFEHTTNRIFYRDHYDSQEVLSKFSKVLVSELELNRILHKALKEICEDLHIQFGQIVVFNNDRVYRIGHFGELPKRLMIAPELAKLNKPLIVADELEGGERKRIMDKHSIRVALSLRTREEFVGYLLLGDKLSGDIYSSQDIELLEIIGKELAVAILNAKAYAEIQAFNLTLQARVDHATNRLRVANRHLKELDHAKDEFISMASHQLRTPLTTIKGYLSMLLEGDAGRITGAQKDFVEYAFGSSERMVNLISDLLNVSRLQAGRFLIQTKPTDMVKMIEDEVRQLQSHAKTKGIGLIFDRPPEQLPPAEIDENKTRQVIMNFIDNAIYYTQQGEVRVVLEQTGDRVRLEVRDTGIGVPEKAKRKLFSKFYRADNAQIVRPDGTGLGLYLAKRVIQDQGGTIIFSSVEGKGSTFGFELPFKHSSPKHEDNHARPKAKR